LVRAEDLNKSGFLYHGDHGLLANAGAWMLHWVSLAKKSSGTHNNGGWVYQASEGQGRTHSIVERIRIRGQIHRYDYVAVGVPSPPRLLRTYSKMSA